MCKGALPTPEVLLRAPKFITLLLVNFSFSIVFRPFGLQKPPVIKLLVALGPSAVACCS